MMNQNEKEEVKSLWKKCFNDSDEFIELYFSKRYTDEINMAIYEDGKVISALQMIPYKISLRGETINASYISGASTDPDYRNRGAMAKLLSDTHKKMYEEDVLLSFLIPAEEWLIAYYSKFGYNSIFFSKYIEQQNKNLVVDTSLNIEISDTINDNVYNYLSEKMLSITCAVQHSFEDLSVVMEDIKLAGGNIAVASRNETICGVTFAVPVDDKVAIRAIIADSIEMRDSLFAKSMELFNAKTVIYRTFKGENLSPYGMARVINLDSLLSVWAKINPDRFMTFYVSDDKDIPQNNGLFVVDNGHSYHYADIVEAYESGEESVVNELTKLYGKLDDGSSTDLSPINKVEEYSINKVVKLLFNDLYPYMSLMMD